MESEENIFKANKAQENGVFRAIAEKYSLHFAPSKKS